MRQARWMGLLFLGAVLAAAFPQAPGAAPATPEAVPATAGYLENVTFEKMPGKERVILTVSKLSGVTVENQPGSAVAVRLENLFVSEELRRPLSDPGLVNVLKVTPSQNTAQGRSWVLATIEMKQKVPYSVRQEGLTVLIDFNTTSLAATAPAPAAKAAAATAPTPGAETSRPAAAGGGEAPGYTGSRIFLDVQEADIRAVFRLLSEQGKVSIVSGDEVKGTVTLHLRDIPWDQALDTILQIKGLTKRQDGSVITIMTLERKKKEETDRASAEEAQRKAEDERKVREQKQNVEEGRLRKIAIEAKIVEVTTNFSRQLGIQWGAGYSGSWGGANVGALIGTGAGGVVTTLPTGIGVTSSNAAVNFPAVANISAPGIGLVFGGAQSVLDAKLSALETNGNGKVISSPKVTTLENEKATIWQGKKVPVVTPATSTSPASVRYEDADLRLIVTPKITQEQDRISMDIDASNKDVDTSLSVMGNPAINTSGVTSKIVVRDGDTIVLGGVYKTIEASSIAGIPLLSKIPFLGWLFKYETKALDTREILIFITPRVIKEANT